ncbi:MAG: CmcI family methyltransferase [Solirubrobacteraceae bacterium]
MFADDESVDLADMSTVMRRLAAGGGEELAALWRSRVEFRGRDSYAGIPMSKFPEDLRTYEQLIWEHAPQVIVEVGVRDGGSTVWLRDRLFDFQRYRLGPAPFVLGLGRDLSTARARFAELPPEGVAGIELIEGDIADDRVAARVHSLVPHEAKVLVIEDSAGDAATTLAALQALAPLVRAHGYYVVGHTCVDIAPLRADDHWPRGSGLALTEWLASDPLGRRFRRRPDLEPYGLTLHPGGVIQREADLGEI